MNPMKFFPLKTLVLCILLPPLLYVLSVDAVQKLYLNDSLKDGYTREIENICIGDPRPLLNGSIRLETAVNRNIQAYLKSKTLLSLGVQATVTIVTRQGKILYPPFFGVEDDLMVNHVQIADQNLNLLNEGRVVNVQLLLRYDALLSFLILVFYMSVSLGVFYALYRAGTRKARQAEDAREAEISQLMAQERAHADKLESLKADRIRLTEEFENVRHMLEAEKAKASRNETEMVEEIVSLESRIQKNLSLQEEQQTEIEELTEKIQELEEKGRKKESEKRRAAAEPTAGKLWSRSDSRRFTRISRLTPVPLPDFPSLKTS